MHLCLLLLCGGRKARVTMRVSAARASGCAALTCLLLRGVLRARRERVRSGASASRDALAESVVVVLW